MLSLRKIRVMVWDRRRIAGLTVMLVFLWISMNVHAEGEAGGEQGAVVRPAADFSDPIKTYQGYLEAILRDDLATAKSCCTIEDPLKTGALDVCVGMWVTFHRFNKIAVSKFEKDAGPYLAEGRENEEHPFLRRDCTDVALKRTIARLARSKVAVDGDKAKLTIQWDEDDGYPNPVFGYSSDELVFRKIGGQWKWDVLAAGGAEELESMFEPRSWGRAFRDGMKLLNAVIMEIEAGKLKTWEEVSGELETRTQALEKEWSKAHEMRPQKLAVPKNHDE